MIGRTYPDREIQRTRWILDRRSLRAQVDPRRPWLSFVEDERDGSGALAPVATIFLTNRECPWRCLMCDLWQHTLTETVPVGAIPAQIDFALGQMPPARHLKLYNSGSFFDPRAIPPEDYAAIADRVRGFERVIVECHPALVGKTTIHFRDLLRGQLEVAMGLETAHPEVLAKLNKRMTLDQFRHAAEFLRQHGIAWRAFILVQPPFLDEDEALLWACRSMDFAFDCGADVASLIPTRFGNGALEALAEQGQFSPPKLKTLEAALDYGLSVRRGRVFADLWDLEQFSNCEACFPARRQRLAESNRTQAVTPAVACARCGSGA
jgi:radical SAM enzyme (TIGR01210 family)